MSSPQSVTPEIEDDADAATALRQFLAGRDAACPGCGYNVRDLPGSICPECGQELTVSLRLQEPKQAALITGLVGLSAGAGLGGLLLIYWAILSVLRPGMPGGVMNRFILINGGGFLIHGGAIVAWLRGWRHIRRMQPTPRRLLVILCCALPIVFVVVFALFLR